MNGSTKMKMRETVKTKFLWWIIGSLGITGIGFILLFVIVGVTMLGMMVASSDSSSSSSPSEVESFEIPIPLLSIYLHAQNGIVSWARLAAINQVTTDFGQKLPNEGVTIGFIGFPTTLWQKYGLDGDGDSEVDPDDPHDAILSLAHYLSGQTGTLDQALEIFQLVPEQIAKVKEIETKNLAELYLKNGWLWPLIGYTDLSSTYGMRTDPFSGVPSFHDGLDIPAPMGTPVLAIRDGTVIFASEDISGYGHLIRIQHDDGTESFYGHQSEILVEVGDLVRQGEVIGLVGTTGKSTGPHLHLGAKQNGVSEDPMQLWSSESR